MENKINEYKIKKELLDTIIKDEEKDLKQKNPILKAATQNTIQTLKAWREIIKEDKL